MCAARVLLVSGKGGCGKTTVAAALAHSLAARGDRTLLVELAAARGVERLFDSESLTSTPGPLSDRLEGARVERRSLIEDYFKRLLPIPPLSHRLLSSVTFNALSAAAPGIQEFLILDRLVGWSEPGRLTRDRRKFIVVDAAATGHTLQLLRTPRHLLRLVSGGPIGSTLQRIDTFLRDPNKMQVVLVSVAEEMSVNETIEAHACLRDELDIRVTRPVLNRAQPRRFSAAEAKLIRELRDREADHPMLAAAGLQIESRRRCEAQARRLRRKFDTTPVSLPALIGNRIERDDLAVLGRRLLRGVL
jgi:anion-transporting  ArsA/GET3 family ATPase